MNKKIILFFVSIVIFICSYVSAYECSVTCEWDGSTTTKLFYGTEVSGGDITNSHVSIHSVGTYTHDLGCSAEYGGESVDITTRTSDTNNPGDDEVLVLCAKHVSGYEGQQTNMHAYPLDLCVDKEADLYLFAKSGEPCKLNNAGEVIYTVTPNSHVSDDDPIPYQEVRLGITTENGGTGDIPVTGCGQVLDVEGGTYVLTEDLDCSSYEGDFILKVIADDVTIDGQGFSIFGLLCDILYSIYSSAGILLDHVTGTTIKNIDIDGPCIGIKSDTSTDTTIDSNTISNTAYGIVAVSSSYLTILGNIIESSTLYGVYLTNTMNSLIYNNFLRNDNNAYDDGNNNWNVDLDCNVDYSNIVEGCCMGGNYYADFSGTGYSETCADVDYNGICDNTYPIPGGSSVDYYPLTITDNDGDGVQDCRDQCPDTVLPDEVPLIELRPYHHAEIDSDYTFEVNTGSKNDPFIEHSQYTLDVTGGCTCKQILDRKPKYQVGNNYGEYWYGCTIGTMEIWINERGWARHDPRWYTEDPYISGLWVSNGPELRDIYENIDDDNRIDIIDNDDDGDNIKDEEDSEPDSKATDKTNYGKGSPDWWCNKYPGECDY